MDDPELRPEVIAEAIIQEMMESGQLEEIRIRLASILHVNGDYEAVKRRTREILQSPALKKLMQLHPTTESDIVSSVSKSGGLIHYRRALQDLLAAKSEIGADLQRDISPRVDRYMASHQRNHPTW
jgi:hypothetical protein